MEEEVEEEVRGRCNHGGKSQKDETLPPVNVEDRERGPRCPECRGDSKGWKEPENGFFPLESKMEGSPVTPSFDPLRLRLDFNAMKA